MEPNSLLRPGDVFGSYRIDEPSWDQDGPIQCYVATDTRNNRQVSFQCIDSRPSEHTAERVERFHAMATKLRGLKSFFLPAFYDAGVTDRIYWAATEHSIGHATLGSILGDPDERLSVSSCFLVAHSIASALRTAHQAGIMHLRLSPDRITLDRGAGSLHKIHDVGMAQLFGLTPDFMRSQPLYAAPEQLRDVGSPADERADIYAFGMVLYAMFAWARPFADKDDRLPGIDKLLLYAMTRALPSLADRLKPCPEFLDVFVQMLAAKVAANRPPNFGVVCDRLSEMAARHVIWGEALDQIGRQDPATRAALIAGLRGPAPEGAELQALLARITEEAGGARGPKDRKPRSGRRPSVSLRAAINGYSTVGSENDPARGTPEPEWFAALPGESEASKADDAPATSPPDSKLVALWNAVMAVLDASRRGAAPAASPTELPASDPEKKEAGAPSTNRDLPGTPPPNAVRHPAAEVELHADTVREPDAPVPVDPATPTEDGAPLSPVTLPSGELGRYAPRDARPARSSAKHAAIALGLAFIASLSALLWLYSPRRERMWARSASLGAACPSEIRALRGLPQLNSPAHETPSLPVSSVPRAAAMDPTIASSATAEAGEHQRPRAVPSAPALIAPPSAGSVGSQVPTPSPTVKPVEKDDDPCARFECPFRNQEPNEK